MKAILADGGFLVASFFPILPEGTFTLEEGPPFRDTEEDIRKFFGKDFEFVEFGRPKIPSKDREGKERFSILRQR